MPARDLVMMNWEANNISVLIITRVTVFQHQIKRRKSMAGELVQ